MYFLYTVLLFDQLTDFMYLEIHWLTIISRLLLLYYYVYLYFIGCQVFYKVFNNINSSNIYITKFITISTTNDIS